jgi:hypothetical protein
MMIRIQFSLPTGLSFTVSITRKRKTIIPEHTVETGQKILKPYSPTMGEIPVANIDGYTQFANLGINRNLALTAFKQWYGTLATFETPDKLLTAWYAFWQGVKYGRANP